MTDTEKLWGGRFSQPADETFAAFNRSFDFDRRLFSADIAGCIAHANGLTGAGVLTADESAKTIAALNEILRAADADDSYFQSSDAEDVHSFIEQKLIGKIGELGKKLHTGRSRNDQVSTCFRLWMRDEIDSLSVSVKDLQTSIVALAEANFEAIMPGYTHLQRAQPVLFAHWCLAYFEMLRRDRDRFDETRRRVNILPLGSAALAGTSYGIDRESVARELGFESVSRNSLDAVSDRDFAIEFLSACSLVMLHLSRFAEDLIIYSSTEFRFIELSDKVATGSSLMPQKKNADSLELIRGKSGRVFGHLTGLLATIKGLPLAYNKDMQEDKQAVFDTADTTKNCLAVAAIVAANVSVNKERMLAAASIGYLNATDLADYLVGKGMPFREAHETVGKIVIFAAGKKMELDELDLADLQRFAELIDEDVYESLGLEATLERKSVIGGTSPIRVRHEIELAKRSLSK